MIFGYKINEGVITVNENEAEIIRNIFQNYLLGTSFRKCFPGITHSSVKRILKQKKYTGNDTYPAIISQKKFDEASSLLKINTENNCKFGTRRRKTPEIHKCFHMKRTEKIITDPVLNAEYLYSLIEVTE